MFSYLSSPTATSGTRYVLVDLTKQKADELSRKYKENKSCYTFEEVMEDAKSLVAEPEDLNILVHQLVKTKRAAKTELITKTNERYEVIKVHPKKRYFSFFSYILQISFLVKEQKWTLQKKEF